MHINTERITGGRVSRLARHIGSRSSRGQYRGAYRYGLAVEQAADSIIMLATDQTARANAHLWKIYCVPVIRQIYSQSDPVVSAFDGLAFAMQCREYLPPALERIDSVLSSRSLSTPWRPLSAGWSK